MCETHGPLTVPSVAVSAVGAGSSRCMGPLPSHTGTGGVVRLPSHLLSKHCVPGDAATPPVHVPSLMPGIRHAVMGAADRNAPRTVSLAGSTMAVTSYVNNIWDTCIDVCVET